jgi:hypothetical protein
MNGEGIRRIDNTMYHLEGNSTKVRFIAVLYETVVNEPPYYIKFKSFGRKG